MKTRIRFFSLMLVTLIGSLAIPTLADEAPKSRYAHYVDQAKHGLKVCAKQLKEIAQDKTVQEYVAVGILAVAAVCTVCWLGRRGVCCGSRKRVGSVMWLDAPRSDTELPTSSAEQRRVSQQRGARCGFEAVRNGAVMKAEATSSFNDQEFLDSAMETIRANRQAAVKEMNLGCEGVRDCGLASSDRTLMVDEVDAIINLLPGNHSEDFLICTADYEFTSERAVNFGTLEDRIRVFKRDGARHVLAIVINIGDYHWIVDVLHKTENQDGSYEYRHILADSMNWTVRGDSTVRKVIKIERRVV